MKDWYAEKLNMALKSTAAQRIRQRLGIKRLPGPNHEISGIDVPAEVVLYFGEAESKLYQLEQWLPVLNQIEPNHKVLLVFRKVRAMREMKGRHNFASIFVRRFEDLMNLYDENDYALCLYVNNGVSNFQSLSNSRMVHVHVNHGESDKLSMVSNQVKAYDKIMIAGPAAQERHRSVLVDFDESKLLTVGRPQLDIDFPSQIAPYKGRTIMYAPTWEGENASNNYSSMDVFGERIVNSVLSLPNVRLVYKPHPRVIDSPDPAISRAHENIVKKLNLANSLERRHIISETGNILAMFESVDALITDVSSVGLDFLYLQSERPLIITDRRDDLSMLEKTAPVSRACPVINSETINELGTTLSTLFDEDTFLLSRKQMRQHYFGDIRKGESTMAFLSALDALINERRKKLESYEYHASSIEQ